MAVAAGCTPSLTTDATVAIRCGSDADCPADGGCVRTLDDCLARNGPCVEERGAELFAATDGNRCSCAEVPVAGVCLAAACRRSRCGDGVVDDQLSPELCDDGAANSDTLPNHC